MSAGGGAAAASTTTTAFTLVHHAGHPPPHISTATAFPPITPTTHTPQTLLLCVDPATMCRATPVGRYGYTQWRHRQYATSITTGPAANDNRHHLGAMIVGLEGVVGDVRKNCSWDNVSEKNKIKLIVYLLYDSILRPSIQLALLSPHVPPRTSSAAAASATAAATAVVSLDVRANALNPHRLQRLYPWKGVRGDMGFKVDMTRDDDME